MKLAALASVFLFVGCDEKAEGPPYEVAVYDAYGSFVSPSNNWQIVLSGDDPGISIRRDVSVRSSTDDFEGTSSVSPSEWSNKEGFICLVADDDRVWAYDGGDRIWVVERFEEGVRCWDANCPSKAPSEFIAKLPTDVKKQFEQPVGASVGEGVSNLIRAFIPPRMGSDAVQQMKSPKTLGFRTMDIELGCDDYPILDQFSAEGFVDLTFKIVDLVEDTDFYRFNLAASFDGNVVGMGVVVRKGMKSGFDSNMDLDREHVYRHGVRFFRAGDRSDRLVAAISKLYEDPGPNWRMIDEETFTAVALHQGEIDMATQRIKLKIFGRDSEPLDEEAYYESFFNVDLPNRLVFWNEKDQDYRASLLRGIATHGENQDAQKGGAPNP